MQNKHIAIGIIGVLIIGSFIYFISVNKGTPEPTTPPAPAREETSSLKGDAQVEMIDQQNKKANQASPVESIPKDTHGVYMNQITINGTPTIDANLEDNKASVEQLVTHTGLSKHVLFFHATWCPECKAANKAFLERETEIPAGVMVIKVDYDTHPELKKQYGVTYQHTFVQVDEKGNQITKWIGGDIAALKKNLK